MLTKPVDKSMTSATLAGRKHEYLYVTCGDSIYLRKVLAEGAHRLK